MERIRLHDKEFRIFIPYQQIEQAINKLAKKINNDYKDEEIPLFLAVLNGAFMFSADLIKQIDFTCEISFVKISSYSGTSSTGVVRELLGLSTSVKDRNVIVVEDIIDTGNTIVDLEKSLREQGARSIKFCTMLFKPDSYNKELPIDYVAMEIPSDFIVGYGLDYNELGRQYKDIYVLDTPKQ